MYPDQSQKKIFPLNIIKTRVNYKYLYIYFKEYLKNNKKQLQFVFQRLLGDKVSISVLDLNTDFE